MKLKNTLDPGQIRYLYLWVHPQWDSPWCNLGSDLEIQKYRTFVQRLEDAPRVGLVHVAERPRSEFAQNAEYTYFIGELEKCSQEAQQHLGNRYLVWNRGRFVNAKDPKDIAILVNNFNLKQESQDTFVQEHERWLAEKQKYLAKISVFGKERDTCPLGQATLFNLHSIASIVRYYSVETPERIIPPTIAKPFPGDGEATYIFER